MMNPTRLIEAAMSEYMHTGIPKVREPGYHASSTGGCMRKVVLATRIPEALSVKPAQTEAIFKIGHQFDEWAKEAIDRKVRDMPFFSLAPFKTTSFRDGDFMVHGEPDVVLLDMTSECIHVIDSKSAAADSWWMKKRDKTKGEVSPMNAGQVACYMDSEELQALKKALGWDLVKGWLAYYSKDNAAPVIMKVPAKTVQEAKGYWNMVKECDKLFKSQQMVPGAFPQFDWECGYCDVWPAFSPGDQPNKTAVKKLRSAHRLMTSNMCRNTDSPYFMNMILEPMEAIDES